MKRTGKLYYKRHDIIMYVKYVLEIQFYTIKNEVLQFNLNNNNKKKTVVY